MANPQLENGFMRISLEIVDALAGIRISGEARQILDVILRKTYGWQKKEDIISLSQFSLITKMSKPRIRQGINKLVVMNLIITKKGNELGNKYRFNKDFSTWKPLPKKVTLTKKGNASLPIIGTTIDTTTKDNIVISKSHSIFQVIMDYYYVSVFKEKGFKPKIAAADGKALKTALATQTPEDIKAQIDFYLSSEKADRIGINLSTIFSAHSVNIWKQKGQVNKFL